jgi:hypothetical protein
VIVVKLLVHLRLELSDLSFEALSLKHFKLKVAMSLSESSLQLECVSLIAVLMCLSLSEILLLGLSQLELAGVEGVLEV